MVIEPGTNDVCVIGRTPAQAWADVISIGLAAKAVGFKTILSTMISRNGCPNGGDSIKNQLNDLERTSWVASGAFDAIADNGATTQLGCDSCSTNNTYFAGDSTHPNTTGQLVMASVYSDVVNSMDGSTLLLPHLITNMSAYSMTPADNYMTWAGDAGFASAHPADSTLTLPTCQGRTGSVYTVHNTSVGSTFTVNTVNSQTLTGATTVGPTVNAGFHRPIDQRRKLGVALG